MQIEKQCNYIIKRHLFVDSENLKKEECNPVDNFVK
jgi:hypothetical protein